MRWGFLLLINWCMFGEGVVDVFAVRLTHNLPFHSLFMNVCLCSFAKFARCAGDCQDLRAHWPQKIGASESCGASSPSKRASRARPMCGSMSRD